MRMVSDFSKLIRGYGQLYVIAFLLLAMATGMFLLLPQKLGEFIELVSLAPSEIDLDSIQRLGVQIAIIALAQAVLSSGYTFTINKAAEKIGNDLRNRFFKNLLVRSWANDGEDQAGSTATQFVSDLSLIQGGLGDTLLSFFRHSLFTVGALTLMFVINPYMAGITLASAAAVAAVCTLFILAANRVMARMQLERASIVALLVESVTNKYAIQAFQVSDYFEDRFQSRVKSSYRVISRYYAITALVNPVAMVVFIAAAFVVIYSGIREISAGNLSVGDLVSFISYVLILIAAIVQAGVTWGKIQLSHKMWDKHAALLAPPESVPETDIEAINQATPNLNLFEYRDTQSNGADECGDIVPPIGLRFENVEFAYPSSSAATLRGSSFSIPAGKTTVLFGVSGAGKSTIAALLIGLIAPSRGQILDFGEGQIARLDDSIAIVPQKPFLFAGTIEENIVFGREGYSINDIRRAAKMAQIDTHIQSLDDGYDSWVSEGGQNLSRGQQQRIALARALIARPRFLILDEATASMDVASEKALKKTLGKLSGSVTVLIIAHQGDLISNADHLVLLADGKAIYEGAPEGARGVKDAPMFPAQLLAPTTRAI